MFFHTYLTDLIKSGDVVAALERIRNNQEINSCTYWEQYTPLHLAIETNQPSIVEALLDAHANVNAVTYHDTLTPLHIAARSADIRSIQALIRYNPNLNAKTYKEHDTALHIAVKHGFLAQADALLMAGAMVDLYNKNHDTALHIAAKQGDMQMITLLLYRGANCNLHNHDEQTPLFLALMAGHSQCVDLLAYNGATFGKSFDSIKKLQANYEQECKKNDALSEDNEILRLELTYKNMVIADLNKELKKLQQIFDNLPTAKAVGGPSPYRP